jgi:cell wall-associated NlpC family hydrolase
MDELLEEITAYCKTKLPEEACGLIVLFKGRYIFLPCENVSTLNKTQYFAIHPLDYATAEDKGVVSAVVHSHSTSGAVFSEWDVASQKASGVPWLLIGLGSGESYAWLNNPKLKQDLYGRAYKWGVHDCYTFMQDWYEKEYSLMLPDFQREEKFWERGQELYLNNFASAGFVEVPKAEIRYGDALLMNLAGKVASHAAVYVGNNQIGHHLNGRLSSKDVMGQHYADRIVKVVRHESLL